jgi:hypothetical protein
MSKVFISYRRETAAGEARALFNDLVTHLGADSVFMDVDSIGLGRDFRAALQQTLANCDLMLVIIDKAWADVKDQGGRIRLSNPGDFIRLEIETALKRDIVVTPILVQGALMPSAETLPIEIKDLAYRNAFEISHNRWESDVREMVKRLGLDVSGGARQIEAGGQPPLPIGATRGAAKQMSWWIGGLVSAFVIAALGGWLVLRGPSVLTFEAPLLDGLRLDACVQWAARCGAEAASAWCKLQGYNLAISYPTENVGERGISTKLIGTGQVCSEKFCTSFTQITCTK